MRNSSSASRRATVRIVTIEENAIMGGAGSGVGEVLAANGLQVPMLHLGIPDRFIEHGITRHLSRGGGARSRRPHRERREMVGAADAGAGPIGS